MTNQVYQLSNKTKRLLWRRVAYSYLLSLLLRPGIIYGILFGSSVQLFRELVFVRMVIKNFLAVEVGQAPFYIVNLFVQADLMKVTLILMMVISLLLLLLNINRSVMPRWRLPATRLGV